MGAETGVAFNAADIVVVVIMLAGIVIGAKKGFLVSVLNAFSSVISLFLTSVFTPFLTAVVRKTFVYTFVFNSVMKKLELNVAEHTTKPEQFELIQGLQIPDFLKNFLMENNNNVVYKILDVHTVNEYICAYIANILTQLIISIFTFVIAFIVVKIAFKIIRVLCKIPVIKQCNAVGGGIVGLLFSVIIVWIAFAVLNLFILKPGFALMIDTIKHSVIAGWMYERDVLLKLLFSSIR